MEFLLSTLLLTTLITVIYWYYNTKYSYWIKRGVVSLPVTPVVGTYGPIVFMKENLSVKAKAIYEKYKNEKFVGGFKGTIPELMIRDPETIKFVLNKDFNFFHDRPGFPSKDNILTMNVFSMQGNIWNILRKKLTPTFTSSKMKKMFPLVVECSEALKLHLEEAVPKSEIQEVKAIMSSFTTDTIGSCAFGLKMNSLNDDNTLFRQIANKIATPSSRRILMALLRMTMPRVLQLLRVKSSSLTGEIEEFFVSLTKQIVQSRQSGLKRHDFMDLLIELKNTGTISMDKNEKFIQTEEENEEETFEMTEELMAAQAFVFFIAGFDTSSATMSWALQELALNQEIQEKVHEEIDRVLNKYDGGITYEAVQEMKYLDMVMDETLRKHPPVGFLNRVCSNNYKFPETDNIIIDKGVEVLIPIFALHYDEKYFPEPDKFIPERFAEDPVHKIQPYTYLPFGEGPRVCIGLRFGKLQAATGLISVLSKYRVDICEKTVINPEFIPTPNIVMNSKDGIWLKVKSRH